MPESLKLFQLNCSSATCPARARKELQCVYCGKIGLCEKLEKVDSIANDKDLEFKYRIL